MDWVATDRVQEIFEDSRVLYDDAIEMLSQGEVIPSNHARDSRAGGNLRHYISSRGDPAW